jgi:Protein of unknown function (DUF2778)
MSTSISACYDFAAHTPRDFSRKSAVPYSLLGSAAVACLVVGCAWTVYTNVFAAGIYPSAGNFDVAVIKRSPAPVRTVLAASNTSIVIESPPVISAPAVVAQGPSFSFADRFSAAAPQSVAAAPQAVATPPQAVAAAPQAVTAPPQPERQVAALAPVTPPPAAAPERKVADAVPMPASRPADARKSAGASVRDMAQRAKAAVMSVASNDKPEAPAKPPTIFERLFGKFESTISNSGSALAYASADASSTGSLGPASQNIASVGTGALYDRQTAVYDIAAHMVYLPDGTKLEAHSGLGSSLDDPRSANIRMRGVTPPHLYDLKPREALFHGVAALRLNPVGGEESIYGRSGLLAHTFMLGPNGDSNGCVSFRDYNAFLDAYRNKGVRRLAVVAHL